MTKQQHNDSKMEV